MLSIVFYFRYGIFALNIKIMRLRHLTYFIILLCSCNLIPEKQQNRNQDFILETYGNFNNRDTCIKIITSDDRSGFGNFPKENNTISVTNVVDSAYYMWANHTQFGGDRGFTFGNMLNNNYNFDSAMYRWSIDTTSLLVTFFNFQSDSSVSYLYNTNDNGDGSYTHTTEIIN